MATTTTTFGWDIPESTDLVKDGATAIAALGQDIDTALIDLKGGTTGQVLTKASGTDLDFIFSTPVGSVIKQVVSASTTTETIVASTSYTDSGLSATITPTSATSKILVLTSQLVEVDRVANQTNNGIRLLRGATSIGEFGDASALNSFSTIVGNSTAVILRNIVSINYMDSPATTSATTYKVQGACNTTSNSSTITFQKGSLIGNMILIEIGA
jgi:hypothetical protein